MGILHVVCFIYYYYGIIWNSSNNVTGELYPTIKPCSHRISGAIPVLQYDSL